MFEAFYIGSEVFQSNITILRRFDLKAYIHHVVREHLIGLHPKERVTLMARIYATDDQVITEVFSQADADKVPVDAAASPVTVAVVDAAGADVSQWIDVAQDTANPLKFVYTRKVDDGTQPQILDFTSIGTGTVNGAPVEFKSDLGFTPGAATSLISTVTVGALAPVLPPATTGTGQASDAASGAGAGGDGGASQTSLTEGQAPTNEGQTT